MDGLLFVRKDHNIRMQKHLYDEVLKIIIPAHRPIKRSTLSHILKQARILLEDFLDKLINKDKQIIYDFEKIVEQ